MTELETERLRLRLPRLEDAEPFLGLHSDPEAMRYLGGIHPDIADDPAYPVRRWIERWETNGFGQFVAERRDDGAVVGRVGFVVWDTRDWRIATMAEAGDHAQPELGWALVPAQWGHGYATEAALAVRQWARDELGFEHLISVIAPENVRSQRVAEKLGCVPTVTVVLAEVGLPAVIWEHPSTRV